MLMHIGEAAQDPASGIDRPAVAASLVARIVGAVLGGFAAIGDASVVVGQTHQAFDFDGHEAAYEPVDGKGIAKERVPRPLRKQGRGAVEAHVPHLKVHGDH